MRKDWLNIMAKISKKLHVQNVVYSLLKYLPIPQVYVDAPEEYLNSLSPEKRNSCIGANTIEEDPQYDLEIIVPVYNAAKYLDQCVMSLINQKTRYAYKVVFVNDGSTDDSQTILEKYCDYSCITIITTPNQGVSAARNIALQHIEARYVLFVDSDDFLTTDAVEKLIMKADETGADIVEGNNRYFINNRTLYISQHPTNRLFGMACGKIYNAKLWKRIVFPLDTWYEDTLNWMVLYQMGAQMLTISDVIYNYRSTPTGYSQANNQNVRRIETYWVTKQLLSDAQSLGIEPTAFYYETFLRQTQLNSHRVAILGDRKADYALFKAHQALRDMYFMDYRAEGQKEKRIESALLKDDFKEYFLYCLFLF